MLPQSGIYFTIIGICQFISMAFLIICCVTAPVFKQIGLAKYEDITYGVFGYCTQDDGCSKASASYNPYSLTENSSSWKLNSNTRKSLGKILIIMPVAAGLNFFSFIAAIISLVLSFIQQSSSISAVSFIIDLIFHIIAFLSAALMCIVSFLLFFPHVTWCTWLLIPAAVLPLFSLVLSFFAYLSKDNTISESDEMILDDNQRLLSVEDLYEHPNGPSDYSNSQTILPDIEKVDDKNLDIILKNTSVTDTSSLDRETYNAYSKTTDDLLNSEENLDNEKESLNRFSVIDNEKGDNMLSSENMKRFNPSGSLASSVYSQKDHYSEVQPKNQILQDFMQDKKLANPTLHEAHGEDKDSLVTSISRNGVNPKYYTDNNNNYLNVKDQTNAPYPYTPSMNGQSINIQRTQQQYHNNIPHSNMNNYTGPMHYQAVPQQFHSQGPSTSEIIMQNNPNFLPNGVNRMNQRMQRPYQQNNFPRNQFPQSSSTHFAPAYKRRINNRVNHQNLNAADPFGAGGAYNFR